MERILKQLGGDLVREDGRVEKLCDHGVGHPIGHVTAWKDWMGVHGCDGCCAAWGPLPRFAPMCRWE
jgi:hypothetical protein